jgi:endonuclease/exonuclease/phosphatase family metal-dependent hydrolase
MWKVLCCNIRGSTAEDGVDNWRFRKDLCAEVIARQAADIICLQETTGEQLQHLESALSGYSAVCALDLPAVGHPRNAVFYRNSTFRLRASGSYWLSETPHVPGSKSWESRCVRLATWAHLSVREGKRELRILNTHLDHISQPARENQARILNEDALAYPPDFAQVLTGDMNSGASNPAIRSFLEAGWRDGFQEVHGTSESGPTFHGFRGLEDPSPIGRIDWIFLRGPIRAVEAAVIRDHAGRRYPSDHYFVSAMMDHE